MDGATSSTDNFAKWVGCKYWKCLRSEITEIIKISLGKEKPAELPLSQSLKATLLTKHGYQNRHKINVLMMHFLVDKFCFHFLALQWLAQQAQVIVLLDRWVTNSANVYGGKASKASKFQWEKEKLAELTISESLNAALASKH